jgi:Ser/Thr protein kinase RdoA (MazF antagonist)
MVPNRLNIPFPFELKRFEFLHEGENKNYLIQSKKQQFYILKQYRVERKQRLKVQDEIELCQYLNQNEIASSQYIPFSNDSMVYVDKHTYTLQKMFDGECVFAKDTSFYYDLGVLYKKLHSLPIVSSTLAKAPLIHFYHYIAYNWDDVFNCPEITSLQLETFRKYRDLVQARFREDQKCFIHFDLHEGNILRNDKSYFIIDWEECGVGHPYLDLAVSITRLLKEVHFKDKVRALLKGYGEQVDLEQLKLAIIYKLLYLLCYVCKFTDIEIVDGREKLFDNYIKYCEKVMLLNL